VGTVSLKSEAASRGVRMLRTAMGPTITGWLEDPAIVEIMLNPDGRLWIDRLTGGLSDTGKRLSAEEGERIVRLVAHHVDAEVHPGSQRLSAELPQTGERFEGLIPPIVAAPAFAIRKPAVAIFTLADYARAGIMTAEQADASRGPQATVRVLSAYDLDRQLTSDGASWLDRRLLPGDRSGIADIGFGAEVRRAMAQRTDELVRPAHARRVQTARCASEPTYSARLYSTRRARRPRARCRTRPFLQADHEWRQCSRQARRFCSACERPLCHDR
jgi:hypothetical protein